MLSDREKRWLWGGGLAAFCLLYLWLALFPLMAYHGKMRRRIVRTWAKLARLESEVGNYARISGRVRDLLRRARAGGGKASASDQLRILVRNVLGEGEMQPALKLDTVWEGEGVVVKHGSLVLRITPGKALTLIQKIDRHYLPMRVVSWTLKRAGGGRYALSMEIVLMEAGKGS